jgi:tetratricopeptide (TPR) repeat protein
MRLKKQPAVPILFILALIMIPCVLFGAYNEFIQAGNAAYKAGGWLEAARNYKKAYLEKPGAQLKKFMDAAVNNAYKEGLSKGNAAYKAGNMQDALTWYAQAQEVFPNKQLENFMAKVRLQAGGPDISSLEPAPEVNGGKDSPLKWVLIGADAGLAALTVVLVLDYNKNADAYNALHTLLDNTTEANYQILLAEKKKVEDKGGLVALCGVAAGLAVAYTLADAFAIHAVFPKDVKASYNLQKKRFEVAVNREF